MKIKIFILLLLILFFSCSKSEKENVVTAQTVSTPEKISFPRKKLENWGEEPPTNSRNITLETFYNAAYISTLKEDNIRAELFLVGILETTEGKEWCYYTNILPHELNISIKYSIKKIYDKRKNERAAYVIREILSDRGSCKK